jgi:hypothetical protein
MVYEVLIATQDEIRDGDWQTSSVTLQTIFQNYNYATLLTNGTAP